jgi:hypothetical protein
MKTSNEDLDWIAGCGPSQPAEGSATADSSVASEQSPRPAVRLHPSVGLTHAYFRALLVTGAATAGVERSVALALIRELPARYQSAHLFWSWIWMLSIPGFLALSIAGAWWIGIPLLLFGTPALAAAVKRSAVDFVLEHAREDPAFYASLVARGVLLVRVESPSAGRAPSTARAA